MARRNLLHRNKVEDFKAYLDEHDIPWRAPRGKWQVMQVSGRDDSWDHIFDNLNTEHVTVPKPLEGLVKRYIKDRKSE